MRRPEGRDLPRRCGPARRGAAPEHRVTRPTTATPWGGHRLATTRDANGGCQLSDILISQRETGKVAGGQAEYQVTIENKCSCPQANVKVRCFSVKTVEPLDKTKIRPVDSEICIITDGKPITKGLPVTFTYAWKTPQSFSVVSTIPQC